MIFGKYINKYYLKYAPNLLLGLFALWAVDYLQLIIPELYQMVINGMNQGYVMVDGVQQAFDMAFLLDKICMPMVGVAVAIVFGRFCGACPFWAQPFGWRTTCGIRCLTMPKI